MKNVHVIQNSNIDKFEEDMEQQLLYSKGKKYKIHYSTTLVGAKIWQSALFIYEPLDKMQQLLLNSD